MPPAIDLSGAWHLRALDGGTSCPMQVPGDAISALVAAGHLPEPYDGRNEDACRWPAEQDWSLSRDFDLDETDYDLALDGLDTVAEVSVNGHVLLSARNSFRRYRVDASHVLTEGQNRIEITFRSNIRTAADAQARQPWPVPYNTDNCPIPNGNMLRKVQCDFGWDWNIALAPFGLYGGIRLDAHGAPRIDDIQVAQNHAESFVDLDITAHVTQAEIARFEICGQSAFAQVKDGQANARIRIDDPDLWWPSGLGPQTLHTLTVTANGAQTTRRIGLRDITLKTDADSEGTGFGFAINGHDTFMRGANWIPADALFSRISQDKTRDLLASAKAAHMNMIRIWGGGRYEADWFYDLCDEMGLLVWQDFMFSCNLYPCDADFLSEVRAEVHDQVRRLSHHACIALWCGDNELVGALNWYPASRDNRDRYLVAYDRLNHTIETALKDAAADANWWPSSPSAGALDFGDAWHDDSKGDMHFWSVWHEGRDFEHYRDIRPRFCSEFGFQSFPSMPVINRFATPADQNIASPVMEAHQKNAGGNARIAETMFRYFRFPERFEDFVYLSQVQQGLAIRTAVEYWRSLKPHCMGALYWQLNDTWPVASWSSLDHGGGWKLLHHIARRFFAPQTVVALPEGAELRLVAVNDARSTETFEVEVFGLTPQGALQPLSAASASVGSDRAITLLQTLMPETPLIWYRWRAGKTEGADHFAQQRYKSLDLADPVLQLDTEDHDGQTVLHMTAQSLALFASVEANVPGRLSDNAMTVLPGQARTITFTPTEPGAAPQFRLFDLFTATRASQIAARSPRLREAS